MKKALLAALILAAFGSSAADSHSNYTCGDYSVITKWNNNSTRQITFLKGDEVIASDMHNSPAMNNGIAPVLFVQNTEIGTDSVIYVLIEQITNDAKGNPVNAAQLQIIYRDMNVEMKAGKNINCKADK